MQPGQQPQFQHPGQQVVQQSNIGPQRSSIGGSLNRQSFQALKMRNATAFANTPRLTKDALKNLLKANNNNNNGHKGRRTSG